MKRYLNPVTESTYFVGSTTTIKALYKSIDRASKKGNTGMCPLFFDFPCFRESKMVYALCVDHNGFMTVINSDTMLSMIVSGEVTEF